MLANGLDWARRGFAVRVAVIGLLAGVGPAATVVVVAAGGLAWLHGGWVFAAPILTVAGVLVGPAIAVGLLTLPTLVRLGRTVAPAERPAVAASPLHASAAAAVVAIYRALAVVAQPPYVGALVGGLAIVAVAAALSVASQRAIAAYRSDGHPTPRARATRWAIVSLAGVAPVTGLSAQAAASSCLPDSYSHVDHAQESADAPHRRVTELTGPADEPADRAVTLTAQTATVTIEDGTTVDAWAFNGSVPGPELRVTVGELLEVTLTNRDIPDGVTIHWHGVEVPNAEDGVAGVTPDAVYPGESHVYRFRPNRAGTFWYHSHQSSSIQVARGLHGVLVVEPSEVDSETVESETANSEAVDREAVDLAVAVHTWDQYDVATLGLPPVQRVGAGASVRLRLLNTDNTPVRVRGLRHADAARGHRRQ